MPSLKKIKPISYFKANAAEMLKELKESGEPYVITQNGEAAAVLMDASEYDKLQHSLALLKLVTMSEQQIREGKVVTLDEVKRHIKERRKQRGH
jgi:prevent-host-death family protein